MRKLMLVLATTAGLALLACASATPALAQVSLDVNIGPPTYGHNYGRYYGYNSRSYNTPYYYSPYSNPGYNTYSNPYPYRYPAPYSRYHDHGYFGR
jgi:hypothetical protein